MIFSEFSGKPIRELERAYAGKGYAEFKRDLAEAVVAGLTPLQKTQKGLVKNESLVLRILQQGGKKATAIANKTLTEVKQKIGFLRT